MGVNLPWSQSISQSIVSVNLVRNQQVYILLPCSSFVKSSWIIQFIHGFYLHWTNITSWKFIWRLNQPWVCMTTQSTMSSDDNSINREFSLFDHWIFDSGSVTHYGVFIWQLNQPWVCMKTQSTVSSYDNSIHREFVWHRPWPGELTIWIPWNNNWSLCPMCTMNLCMT